MVLGLCLAPCQRGAVSSTFMTIVLSVNYFFLGSLFYMEAMGWTLHEVWQEPSTQLLPSAAALEARRSTSCALQFSGLSEASCDTTLRNSASEIAPVRLRNDICF